MFSFYTNIAIISGGLSGLWKKPVVHWPIYTRSSPCRGGKLIRILIFLVWSKGIRREQIAIVHKSYGLVPGFECVANSWVKVQLVGLVGLLRFKINSSLLLMDGYCCWNVACWERKWLLPQMWQQERKCFENHPTVAWISPNILILFT